MNRESGVSWSEEALSAGGEVVVISSAELCRCRGGKAVGCGAPGCAEKRWALLAPFPQMSLLWAAGAVDGG